MPITKDQMVASSPNPQFESLQAGGSETSGAMEQQDGGSGGGKAAHCSSCGQSMDDENKDAVNSGGAGATDLPIGGMANSIGGMTA